jgi:NADPH:quinone reductase-like Zn-dependent oxidoreductase
VGAYAVQLAHRAGARVLTTAAAADEALLQSLGANKVIDYKTGVFEDVVGKVDAVIDTVGGEVLQRSYAVIKKGGYLISLTQPVSEPLAAQYKIHALFSQLQPSHEGLAEIARLIDGGQLKIGLGNVYAMQQAAAAWDELSGAPDLSVQRKKGRVVLSMPLPEEVQQNIAFAELLGVANDQPVSACGITGADEATSTVSESYPCRRDRQYGYSFAGNSGKDLYSRR